MAGCLVGPAASKTLDCFDRAFQRLWHYIVDVYNAPADHGQLESRIMTDIGLIATAQEGANVPYVLNEADRRDVETKFLEVYDIMTEAQTVAKKSIKGFGRTLWPFRQQIIKNKLEAIENQVNQVLQESQRYYITSTN